MQSPLVLAEVLGDEVEVGDLDGLSVQCLHQDPAIGATSGRPLDHGVHQFFLRLVQIEVSPQLVALLGRKGLGPLHKGLHVICMTNLRAHESRTAVSIAIYRRPRLTLLRTAGLAIVRLEHEPPTLSHEALFGPTFCEDPRGHAAFLCAHPPSGGAA